MVAAFLAIHSIAARWIYSYVPYDEWILALTGHSLNARFGWHRNHFDRFVHLSYGVCLTPAFAQMATAKSRAFRYALAAITLGEEAAASCNGQQGDIWDAHKDMLLATIGSLLWWPKYWKTELLRVPPEPPNRDAPEQ